MKNLVFKYLLDCDVSKVDGHKELKNMEYKAFISNRDYIRNVN